MGSVFYITDMSIDSPESFFKHKIFKAVDKCNKTLNVHKKPGVNMYYIFYLVKNLLFLKKVGWYGGNLLNFYFIFSIACCFAQQIETKKDQYIFTDQQKFQIVVHIWGEVNKPGQYIVQDGTNVLELISFAGGPTEYSKLSNVKLTRECFTSDTQQTKDNLNQKILVKKTLISIDFKKYLEKDVSEPIPILRPGDVVKVDKNLWSRWQTLIRVVSQVAMVIQAIYLYNLIQ